MMIAKQMDIRANIKKYFDIAYDGEPVVVPRKQDRNVVIISESEYNRLSQAARLSAYSLSLISPDRTIPKAAADSTGLKAHNLRKLSRIRSMKKNWNGNGAPPFPSKLVDKVESLIGNLTIQPEVFPTAFCTIQFEYDNSRRDHLEIEIDGSDTAEVFIIRFNGEESFEKIAATPEAINERIGVFYG